MSAGASTVVCICTYRRPDGITHLLKTLTELDQAAGLEVVVVDSDTAGEGHAAVTLLIDAGYPYQVHLANPEGPGISHARNAAVRAGLATERPLLAFLDDDEWPSNNWLSELHRVQTLYEAEVVGGPTQSVFPAGTTTAIMNNPYYGATLEAPDGATCQLEAAGNFMIQRRAIEPLGPDFFDPAYTFSGGEDLAFFTRLAQRGASMHWAAHALVNESVPAERLTHDWLRERVITIHNARVRVMQKLQPGVLPALTRAIKTTGLGVVSVLMTIAGLVSTNLATRAELQRWKFKGKLTAHLRQAAIRSEMRKQ